MLIVAYGFGFYIILHNDRPIDASAPKDAERYVFFDGLGISLVKTSTMFIGELEFSNLPIKGAGCYLFLLVFVISIVVVMMNLLIGLAVSDISIVRQEAEIYSCQSQVEITAELVICGYSIINIAVT